MATPVTCVYINCLLLQEEMAAHADGDAPPQAESPSTSLATKEEERQGMSASAETSTSQVATVTSGFWRKECHCCESSMLSVVPQHLHRLP